MLKNVLVITFIILVLNGCAYGYSPRLYYSYGPGGGLVVWDSELQEFSRNMNFIQDEYIREIGVYKSRLPYIPRIGPAYHAFIIFETDKYYWSLEKDTEQVTLQRSTRFSNVRDWTRNRGDEEARRTPISQIVWRNDGTGTLRDLLYFLWREDLVGRTYDLTNANCQQFASRIYNRFSRRGVWRSPT